jgi:hypothetical protein
VQQEVPHFSGKLHRHRCSVVKLLPQAVDLDNLSLSQLLHNRLVVLCSLSLPLALSHFSDKLHRHRCSVVKLLHQVMDSAQLSLSNQACSNKRQVKFQISHLSPSSRQKQTYSVLLKKTGEAALHRITCLAWAQIRGKRENDV